MIGSYEVMLCGKKVGSVYLQRQGLYYHLRCSCGNVDPDIYRLLGGCAGERVRLGVLVPEGNRLVLETKIPVKKLNWDDPEFWIEGTASKPEGIRNQNHDFKYIPIYPDEPFDYLTKLKKSYLEYRDGKPGIRIID